MLLSGVLGGSATGAVAAKGSQPLASPSLPRYPVNFTEQGLPAGANWTVTLNATSLSSTSPSIVLYVPNGSYPFSVGAVGGYVPTQATGTVLVAGGNNTVVATLAVAGSQPWGGTLDQTTGDIYMAYQQQGNLSVINGSTDQNLGNISVGNHPAVAAFDTADGDLYVPNTGSNNVTVVDPTTNASVASVSVGSQPIAAAFDPANGMLYVANTGGNSVSVVEGATPLNATVLVSIPVGTKPTDLAYDPIDQEIYVVNGGSDNLSVINGTTNRVVLTIPTALNSGPLGLALDAANGEFYITQQGSAACTSGGGGCSGLLLNASTNGYVGTFSEGPKAAYPAFDANNSLVYVPNDQNPGTVTAVSSTGGKAVATIAVGSNPQTVVADANTGLVYVANFASNSISIINGSFYNLSIAFVPQPPTEFDVNFTETGLPTGTGWSISANGTIYGSHSAFINITEPNGSYPFQVRKVTGYAPSPKSGRFYVNASNSSVSIRFASLSSGSSAGPFAWLGLSTTEFWALIAVAGLAAASAVMWVTISRRRAGSHGGQTIAAVAASAGFPRPISEGRAPSPAPPSSVSGPAVPAVLPPVNRAAPPPPPPKPEWSED